VAFQFVCQLALLTSWGGAIRVGLRSIAFVASAALIVVLRRRGAPLLASARIAVFVLVLLGFEILHPLTNGVLSGIAHWALYLAILGPLFWVPRLEVTPKAIQRLMLIFWLFHTVSAGFGVLQVVFPGSFQPRISDAVQKQGRDYVTGMEITLASGERTLRPMGLTDVPGGAGPSGVYATLFSVGMLYASRKLWQRVVALAAMPLGMAAVYLSHVRVSFVMLLICLTAAGLVLLLRRGVRRVAGFVTAVAVTAVLAYGWSVGLAGQTVSSRIESLTEDDPGQVYYRNRGVFLEYTIKELLPEYPLGAGLGRWSMVNAYLGDTSDPERGPLWAEIQITGWLYDGGVLLIFLYGAALALAIRQALQIAVRTPSTRGLLWLWSAVLFAYDIGAAAVTFSYPVFIGQSGLEFWLFNAVLFSAAVREGVIVPRKRRVAG